MRPPRGKAYEYLFCFLFGF
uniref:Uncharacterized protein n=1 Tax=Rhizophora mucronata TaxID=61149 RepID=A0A2P2QWA9_RHIMU